LFYIRGQIVTGVGEFIPTLEEVPLEAQPIKVFVEDCVRQVATDGIIKMAVHGGYVDPSDAAYGSVFSAGIYPTESEALTITENSKSMMPYWWYLSSPNDCLQNCQFKSNRPGLYKTETAESSIEGQIDTYIKRNLAECLNDFTAFRQQGFSIEVRGEIKPDFKIAEKEALVMLSYPIRLSKEGKVIDIEQFFTKVDVNLKRAYQLATDIVNSEIGFNFLEKHTLNLIAMYSKPIGVNRLPPPSHMSFSYDEYLIWTTSETRDRLESYVLPPGTSMLQIANTANLRRHIIYDPETQKYDRVSTGIMDKTLVTLNSTNQYPWADVRLVYLDWWPIYLNINDAEVLKPTEIGPSFTGPLFDLLGMKNYQFLYDLSYPVLVTITDPFAFSGKGLKFVFAIEVNLRNNAEMNSSFYRLPREITPSYFCDINQMNSGTINVELEEMYIGDPVPDAKVDFIAGGESCFIGFTELNSSNKSVLSAKFPIGAGEIKIVKEGYIPVRKQFSALLDEEGYYKFMMMPLLTINASVSVVPLVYQSGKYILPSGITLASLGLKEQAVMTFKRLPLDDFGKYSAYLVYNATGGTKEMLLVPGIYEVKGSIIYKDTIRIPKEEKVIDIPFADDKTITLNESIMSSWTTGGVVFNNVTGYLEVKRDDLINSQFVRFKMLRFPLPITHSNDISPGPELSQASKHEEYSNLYKHELQPDWVR
jgi:hypothetical protein